MASYFHCMITWNLWITQEELFAPISEAQFRLICLPYCSVFNWIKLAGYATLQSLKEFTLVGLAKREEEKSLPILADLLSPNLFFL